MYESLTTNAGEVFAATYASLINLLGVDFTLDSLSLDALPDFNFDLNLDTPDLTNAGSAQPLAASTDSDFKPLTKLGTDPVARADATGDAITNAYEGGDASPVNQAMAEVAQADNMSPNERAAYLEAMKDPSKLKEVEVPNGTKLIMADGTEVGSYGAKKVVLALPEGKASALMGTYTYVGEDGKTYKETFYIFKDCANTAVLADADTLVTQQVTTSPAAPEACGETAKITLFEGDTPVGEDGEPLTGNDKFMYAKDGEKIAVVEITGARPEDVLQDVDGDGDYVDPAKNKFGLTVDQADILPGITPERVADDIAAFEKQYGYRPRDIVYNVTDCNGRNFVFCWSVENSQWHIPYVDNAQDQPIYKDRRPIWVDSDKELDDYLKFSKEVSKK